MASYMLVRHKVNDFSEWKRVYDEDAPNRAKAGLSERYVLRGVQDPNEVVLLFEAADIDRANAFAGSQELRMTMQQAGVVDQPDIYYLNG